MLIWNFSSNTAVGTCSESRRFFVLAYFDPLDQITMTGSYSSTGTLTILICKLIAISFYCELSTMFLLMILQWLLNWMCIKVIKIFIINSYKITNVEYVLTKKSTLLACYHDFHHYHCWRILEVLVRANSLDLLLVAIRLHVPWARYVPLWTQPWLLEGGEWRRLLSASLYRSV